MKSEEVPGNTLASMAALQRTLMRQAEALHRVDLAAGKLWDEGWLLTGMRVRFPDEFNVGYLVVGKRRGPQGAQVAFHDAPTLVEALVGWAERLNNGTLKWTEDKYAGG